jgi:hypothetical protein
MERDVADCKNNVAWWLEKENDDPVLVKNELIVYFSHSHVTS